MSTQENARSGGRLVVDTLRSHGVRIAFTVPGESFLEILDAFHDVPSIAPVTCRHESGAAFMAEALGKLTGRPGVAIVTRGPGACNASIGVHTAFQDSSPMVLLVGQVARDQAEREAFQEVDFRRMFAPLAKWAAQVDQVDRIPELLSRAFSVAASGRPGPVVLAFPEDVLADMASVADAPVLDPVQAGPTSEDVAQIADRLGRAERPLAILGGGGWTDAAAADIQTWAEAAGVPVAATFRRLDCFRGESPCFIGELGIGANPKLVRRVGEADLLLVIGARLGEMTSQGYTLLGIPQPRQALIHVHACAEEPGRVFKPVFAVQASPARIARGLAMRSVEPRPSWRAWRESARADFIDWIKPRPCAGDLDLASAFQWLRERLPSDAIITNDAGNFSGWASRYLRYGRPGRQLGPTSGAMGYGVPAAVAAKLLHPERMVVGMVGDGGFLMTGQELATALQYGAAPILLVFNNGMYGTIRMHQERRHPGRVVATGLANPDFAALARSYGAFGARVERTEDFAPAFEDAAASGRAAVLELRMDPDQITTGTTLTAIRAAAG